MKQVRTAPAGESSPIHDRLAASNVTPTEESRGSDRGQVVDELAATTQIFCLSGESLYDSLAEALGERLHVEAMYDIRELAVVLKFERGELAADRSIREMADGYFKRIISQQPDGPHVIAGFSAGGAVAFEVAHMILETTGIAPTVVLFDTLAVSGLKERSALSRQVQRLANLRKNWRATVSGAVQRIVRQIQSQRSTRQQARRSTRLTKDEMNLIRWNFYRQALRIHVARPYPGPILVLKATEAERPGDLICDEQLGWGNVALGPLEVYEYPCDHLGILEPPHIAPIADHIANFVDRYSAVAE